MFLQLATLLRPAEAGCGQLQMIWTPARSTTMVVDLRVVALPQSRTGLAGPSLLRVICMVWCAAMASGIS